MLSVQPAKDEDIPAQLNGGVIKGFLRRHPWLYSLVYRARFLFSPSRLFGKVFVQARHRAHRRMTTVIAGPGHLGFAGGVYNPGAVASDGAGPILLAKAQACHWWDAIGTKADLYYQGSPVLFQLDNSLGVVSSHVVVTLKNFPDVGRVGYEDFRMFRYGGEVWVNHSMIPLVRKNPCVWISREARPCLSRLESGFDCLTFLGHPRLDFPINPIEKNWIYLEQGGELFLFYSFAPYRVLKLADRQTLRFATAINKQLSDQWADLGGFGTMISFSTNPIEYDKANWFLLVHQIEPGRSERIYHHWGVLIAKATLLPHKRTARPLFCGTGARGRKPGIVYVSAVVKRGETFTFFMGEGDAHVTHASLPQDALDKLWVGV